MNEINKNINRSIIIYRTKFINHKGVQRKTEFAAAYLIKNKKNKIQSFEKKEKIQIRRNYD